MKIKASFGDVSVDIYYRTENDVAPGRPMEQEHVKCYKKYHDKVSIVKGVMNLLSCMTSDEALRHAARALKDADAAVATCDKCNSDLDAKGGPHGH